MSVHATITEAEIAAGRAKYPQIFSADPKERLRSWLVWGGSTILTVYCLNRFGFLSWDFLHGAGKFGSIVVVNRQTERRAQIGCFGRLNRRCNAVFCVFQRRVQS